MVLGNNSEDKGLEGISPRVAMISHRMIRIAVFARFPASVPSLNLELVLYPSSFPLLWWLEVFRPGSGRGPSRARPRIGQAGPGHFDGFLAALAGPEVP